MYNDCIMMYYYVCMMYDGCMYVCMMYDGWMDGWMYDVCMYV